jgi:DNA-binding NarL/FixJ family response regulator
MKQIQILLVDDEESVRRGLRYRLELEKDLRVVGECASGEDALFQVEKLSPNIVIMDTWLPGINGIEACGQLTKTRDACDVIILATGEEFANDALIAGAAGYFPKGMSYDELVTVVRLACKWQSIKAEFELNGGSAHRLEATAPDIVSQSGIPETRAGAEFDWLPRENNLSNTAAEVTLEIPSPNDATQLQRFIYHMKEMFQASVLETLSSWSGNFITLRLRRSLPLKNIVGGLLKIPEVEEAKEKTTIEPDTVNLYKKAESASRKRIKVILSQQVRPLHSAGRTKEYVELPELQTETVRANVK